MASSVYSNGDRPLRPPEELITYLLDQSHRDHHLAGIEYRQAMLREWNIAPGSSVLEIGCGQGEFTVCLADAVGPNGRIVAVDSAYLGWGTPCIIESQNHLMATPIGKPISFVNDTALNYVSSLFGEEETGHQFDYVLFGHCIWFFDRPQILGELLKKLRPWTRAVLIAEFSFSTSIPAAFPHVLVAEYSSTVEALLDDREVWNIRCPLTPSQLIEAARRAGFALTAEKTITPDAKNREASREVRMLLHAREWDEERERVGRLHGDKVASMLRGLKDVVAASVERLDGGVDTVRNMDVWLAKFE
ncbi:S-adenosyl-L-methionine-dependent methyltransferase [Echria macrotheca]|uniref:S-adenosyl-L-methionine-dependent methyltransferase n=1 Tax=Echria macrotheca TaxID=438768 RepID=A0AAJ0F2F8_9PEZI|nr:S-adenosyl-L-methionine-dependent methyltransferase [Echria macrotheca]